MKEGVERKVDVAIYYNTMENIICLTEVKTIEQPIEDCVRQNTDQMRAFCVCNNKKNRSWNINKW